MAGWAVSVMDPLLDGRPACTNCAEPGGREGVLHMCKRCFARRALPTTAMALCPPDALPRPHPARGEADIRIARADG